MQLCKVIDIFMLFYLIIFKEGIYIIVDIFLDSKIINNNELSSNATAAHMNHRGIVFQHSPVKRWFPVGNWCVFIGTVHLDRFVYKGVKDK